MPHKRRNHQAAVTTLIFLILYCVVAANSFVLDKTTSTKTTMSMSSSAHAASTTKPMKIAVVGAGAAGLAATRILSRTTTTTPSSITVLEKDERVGGIWDYRAESSNIKKRPMYRGLRTNLPKEVMQYREFPWKSAAADDEKASFMTHKKVAEYLRDYEEHFGMTKFIQFGATVKQLTMSKDSVSAISTPTDEQWPKIQLEWEAGSSQEQHSEEFDAVFVCNGHYAQPSSPHIPGLIEYYKGDTMHSISYDNPQDFAGKTVLCIGGRASGSDLARELSFHTKHVYLSDTTCSTATEVVAGDDDNSECNPVTWVPKTVAVNKDGSMQFDNDCPLHPTPDCIIFCSGYDYAFPFINDQSNLDLDVVPGERRVKPLYKQLWHAQYPNLAFIGLPHSVVPFPMMELQSEAAWAQWQNCDKLPNLDERMKDAQMDAESGGAGKLGRVQDTHFLGDQQWDYCREMARYAGHNDNPKTAKSIEAYISMNKALYDYAGKARKSLLPGGPDTYRSLVFERDPTQEKFDVLDPLAGKSSGRSSSSPVNVTFTL